MKEFKCVANPFISYAVDGYLTKELKSFHGVSEDGDYESEKAKAVMLYIRDVLMEESTDPSEDSLAIRYLYDEWDYEGCGSEDHYYFTFADEKKEIKKFTKEAEKAIEKLQSIGVKAKLVIEE